MKAREMLASFTDRAPERVDGIQWVECPVCGEVVLETDIERYYEEGTESRVEICNMCREDFERESGETLEADVIDTAQFGQLWDFMSESVSG